MKEIIISICKRDPNGPIKNKNGDSISILEYPWNRDPGQELPSAMNGNYLFNIAIPENYLEIYDKLPNFIVEDDFYGLERMLNGEPLNIARDCIICAIQNIHTMWPEYWIGKTKDWTKATPDNARKALENLLEIIHICIDTYRKEWDKTCEWFIKYKTNTLEVYVRRSLI